MHAARPQNLLRARNSIRAAAASSSVQEYSRDIATMRQTQRPSFESRLSAAGIVLRLRIAPRTFRRNNNKKLALKPATSRGKKARGSACRVCDFNSNV
jgi:hypothetical protein